MEELVLYIKNNRDKVLGGFFGFLFGILVLRIGFFKTIFLFMTTYIGYIIGSKSYTLNDIKGILFRLFSYKNDSNMY